MANLSIFQGLLQRPKSVAEYDQEAATTEGLNLQNQTRGLANQTAQRGFAQEDQLQALMKGLPQGASDLDRMAALKGIGRFDVADKLDTAILNRAKSTAAAAKDTADAASTTQKTQEARKSALLRAVPTFNSSDDVKEFLVKGAMGGHITEDEAKTMWLQIPNSATNMQGFKDWQLGTLRSLMAPDKQMEYVAPTANTVANNQTSVATNAATNARVASEGVANRGVQMRGQNMTDARTRESTSATMTKPFEVTGPDGVPMLVQQDKQGNITPVTGYAPKMAADKPLNEGQAKALGFGTRMQEADKIMADLAKAGTAASVPGMNAGYGIGSVVTALASDKQQQLGQAKRDFLNAILRRESGAAIGQNEFDSGDKQYFPQVGDSPAVIAQKDRNRKLAIKGVLVEVPEKRRASITPGDGNDVLSAADAILRGGK